MFDRLNSKGYEIAILSHAEAILERDFPSAVNEVEDALVDVQVPITEIIGSGGGETKGTQRMRRAFAERGWRKTNFEIKKIVNGVEKESISHEIDHSNAPGGYVGTWPQLRRGFSSLLNYRDSCARWCTLLASGSTRC